MQKIMTNLRKLVSIHGVAYVAYRLGYKDTQAIQKWFEREEIPQARIEAVKNLIKKELQ